MWTLTLSWHWRVAPLILVLTINNANLVFQVNGSKLYLLSHPLYKKSEYIAEEKASNRWVGKSSSTFCCNMEEMNLSMLHVCCFQNLISFYLNWWLFSVYLLIYIFVVICFSLHRLSPSPLLWQCFLKLVIAHFVFLLWVCFLIHLNAMSIHFWTIADIMRILSWKILAMRYPRRSVFLGCLFSDIVRILHMYFAVKQIIILIFKLLTWYMMWLSCRQWL